MSEQRGRSDRISKRTASGNRRGQRCVPKECKVIDRFQGRLIAKANTGGNSSTL